MPQRRERERLECVSAWTRQTMPMTEEASNEEILLLRLTRTERRVLIANLRYSKTKDNRHLRKLNMGVELWYLAQDSLVEKSYANWTEKPDWDDGRVGETSNVITPGRVYATALGREALKANTLPKRAWRSIAGAMPRFFWLAVPAVVGAVVSWFPK